MSTHRSLYPEVTFVVHKSAAGLRLGDEVFLPLLELEPHGPLNPLPPQSLPLSTRKPLHYLNQLSHVDDEQIHGVLRTSGF